MRFRTVGRIRKTHGLDGKLFIIVDNLDSDVVCSLKTVFYGHGEDSVEDVLDLTDVLPYKDGYLITVRDLKDISSAERLVKKTLCLPEDEIPLQAGSSEQQYLEGYSVVDDINGEILATALEIRSLPAQDLLVAEGPDGREILVPMVPEFIAAVDDREKQIRIRPIPGLLDAN